MTTRYCGPGGSNANSGLTWALRKLTLNGVEDTPVVAGDTVYVGAGTYRELLTIDVSGTAGNPITYIGDVTGVNTDGIGGICRVTGSDDDQTATRGNCITATSRNYRTFRGIIFDTTTSHMVTHATACGNWIYEDCWFGPAAAGAVSTLFSGTGTTNTVRRCVLNGNVSGSAVSFTHTSVVDTAAHVVENCHILGPRNAPAIATTRVGGIAVRNCTLVHSSAGVQVVTAITVGQTVTVNNCLFVSCGTALVGTVSGEIVEDYNDIFGCQTARTNTAIGTNTVAYPPLFEPFPLFGDGTLQDGAARWLPFSLSDASLLKNRAGTGVASLDLFGTARPQGADSDWGAVEDKTLTASASGTKRRPW